MTTSSLTLMVFSDLNCYMSLQEAAKNVCILNPLVSEFVPRAKDKAWNPTASHMSMLLRRKMKVYEKRMDIFNLKNNNDLPAEVALLILTTLVKFRCCLKQNCAVLC